MADGGEGTDLVSDILKKHIFKAGFSKEARHRNGWSGNPEAS